MRVDGWAKVAGGLMGLCLAASCGGAGGASPRPAAARPAVPRRPAAATRAGAHADQVETLHPVAPPPASPTGHRNPFEFGGGGGEGQAGRPPVPGAGADSLPELPLPLPGPSLNLLGIAATADAPPVRTAIVVVGQDLVLAHEGDVLGGRFRVVRIGEDSVDLEDAVGARPVHLAWR
jgi:hypothetical protein